MIDLRRAEIKGKAAEEKFVQRAQDEGIPYRYGAIKANGQRQESVILVGKFAVSFKPFKAEVAASLMTNKFQPQVWHESELRWQGLGLNRRLLLHR